LVEERLAYGLSVATPWTHRCSDDADNDEAYSPRRQYSTIQYKAYT